MNIHNIYDQYIIGKKDESLVYTSIVSWAEKNNVPQQKIEQLLKPYFPISVLAVENKDRNITCVWSGEIMDYELKILLCKGNHEDIKIQAQKNGTDIDDINQSTINNILLQTSGVPIVTKFG